MMLMLVIRDMHTYTCSEHVHRCPQDYYGIHVLTD